MSGAARRAAPVRQPSRKPLFHKGFTTARHGGGLAAAAAAAVLRDCEQMAESCAPPHIGPMKFLCDEMVGGLARWLRAAGYDTALPAPAESDRNLVERAAAQGRTILTRDGAMAERRLAAGRLFALDGDRVGDWAAQMTQALAIDWLAAPFSRCLLCNQPLAPHPLGTAALPERLRDLDGPVMRCACCDKTYWRGGHVRRMEHRLRRWHAGDFA